jgi:hypothetical protein
MKTLVQSELTKSRLLDELTAQFGDDKDFMAAMTSLRAELNTKSSLYCDYKLADCVFGEFCPFAHRT